MERRNTSSSAPSLLPHEYLKMISEVFSSHFDQGLKIYEKINPEAYFVAHGKVFSNEIVLSISLTHPHRLSATTLYASVDFDPKASSPTLQDLLSACVDALEAGFSVFLNPEDPGIIYQLAEESLSPLENAPFDWTLTESHQKQVFIKIDKSNPALDFMTEKWLQKNDPELEELELKNEKEMEKLFITGPKQKRS